MAEGATAAFFSYSREDSDFALRLAEDLKAADASVWLDQLDIAPGQRWDRAVEDALASCPRMLVILSPASVNSANVMDEVSFALDEEKTVIPVMYKDCIVPFRLRRVQHVDFRRDYDRGLKQLLRTLATEQKVVQARRAVSNPPSQTDVTEPDKREQLAKERPKTAEQARLEKEQRRTAARRWRSVFSSKSPTAVKVIATVFASVLVGLFVYWVLLRQHSNKQRAGAQKGETQVEAINPTSAVAPQKKPEIHNRKSQMEGTNSTPVAPQTKRESSKGKSNVEATDATTVNPQLGWAVGEKGTILHTADSGSTWQRQDSGTPKHLHAVAFITPKSGWAVGDEGTVPHTEDGGNTWQKQDSETTTKWFLRSVTFVTPQSGWLVGNSTKLGRGGGTILHTEDGGRTWSEEQSSGNSLYSVAFVTLQSGWAVGGRGTILHTEDVGHSWYAQESSITASLHSVVFVTLESGWVVGSRGTILHTEDSGRSWQQQNSDTTNSLYSVAFVTPQAGWAVGDKGTILHTEDAGRSWTIQYSGTPKLHSLVFVTPKSGWAVGDKGTILHTEDGGGTWQLQSSGTIDDLLGVTFLTGLRNGP